MRLADLDASFVGEWSPPITGSMGMSFRQLPSIEGAQGVMFVCPKCQRHSVIVWFANPRNAPVVPESAFPRNASRWTFNGETIDTLTLSPSIDLSRITPDNPEDPSRCYWHGFVTNGEAQ